MVVCQGRLLILSYQEYPPQTEMSVLLVIIRYMRNSSSRRMDRSRIQKLRITTFFAISRKKQTRALT